MCERASSSLLPSFLSSFFIFVVSYPTFFIAPRSGVSGTLRSALTADALEALLAESPADDTVVLLAPNLLTSPILTTLAQHDFVKGVVIQYAESRSSPWSPDLPTPNIPPDSPSPGYAWNAAGDGLMYDKFPFAMNLLSRDDSRAFSAFARWNGDALAAFAYPAFAMQLEYPMFATNSTGACLESGTCLPVGGFSVFSTFTPISNASQELVFLSSHFDAASLFHDAAPGLDAAVSGSVALLAVYT